MAEIAKLVCGSKFIISLKVSHWTIHLVHLFKNTDYVSPLLSGDSKVNSIFTLFGTVFVGEAKNGVEVFLHSDAVDGLFPSWCII